MIKTDPYEKLMSDEKWGPECTVLLDLEEAAESHPTVVGGAVRDLMLDRPISDLDIATSKPGTAGRLAEAFAKVTRRKLVEYSHVQTIYRVVGRSTPQVDFTDPVGGTRESDLERRDFTINALGLGLVGKDRGKLFDPTGGKKDQDSAVIRMTSAEVFEDDPLRLLRAFRFSAQLGFSIDKATFEEISRKSLLLRNVAGERIQLELLAAIEPEGMADRVREMDSCGVLRMLFPELGMQKGVEQNGYHHLDVWEHTIETVRQIEAVIGLDDDVVVPYGDRIQEYLDYTYPSGHTRRSLVMLAMLLHDIAKPHCRAVREDGRVTFIGHERKGAELVREHLAELKFPVYEREFVCNLIAGHLRPAMLSRDAPGRHRVAYRFFRDFEEASLGILLMALADRLGAQGTLVTDEINERHRYAVGFLLDCLFNQAEVIVRPPQLIDGGTLMHELNMEPGPMIGHLLRSVQEAQVMGDVKTREEALQHCREILKES